MTCAQDFWGYKNSTQKKMNKTTINLAFLGLLVLASCKKEETEDVVMSPVTNPVVNPDTAPEVTIDRFSADAGTLMIRDGSNGLPTAGQAINFDMAPFITHGLGPDGEHVSYYNFDVQPITPAPIYVLFRSGSSTPVDGQLNIINTTPGEPDYTDFWNVVKVTVPADYVANTVTSRAEIMALGYTMEQTNTLVNCPVVPEGSTAMHRIGGGGTAPVRGWYKDQVVYYFSFEEDMLSTNGSGNVPTSPIYVTFNVNPPEGGPPTGFVTESGTDQTHNVLGSLPGDLGYSPLWSVFVFDNADFADVMNFTTAVSSTVLASDVMTVNCPMAEIE